MYRKTTDKLVIIEEVSQRCALKVHFTFKAKCMIKGIRFFKHCKQTTQVISFRIILLKLKQINCLKTHKSNM
jgi:hypothetical protein